MEPIVEFEVPDFREITEDGARLLIEVRVKSNGVWFVHKSDPDNHFPSDFHADREDAPEKLDIYTGKVYDRRSKRCVRTMPRKAMLLIRGRLEGCKEPEIQAKLSRTDRFSWLN